MQILGVGKSRWKGESNGANSTKKVRKGEKLQACKFVVRWSKSDHGEFRREIEEFLIWMISKIIPNKTVKTNAEK